MKSKTLLLLLLSSAFTVASKKSFSQNWQLVWSDEFTNGISSDWAFETGNGSGGWGNNELEYYLPANATVQNGQLVIAAKNQSYSGFNYTSVRMKTQGLKSWKYGKIEARIATPSFQGVWPAFWMLGDNISSVGWPDCGEIDIMEHVNTGSQVNGTIHWRDNNGNQADYGNATTAGDITQFHVYSIEWTPASIKWFVDGVQYNEANILNNINGTNAFNNNNFFLLLNLAIGGNWPGFSIDNSAFPANMYVDYVRVYQNAGTNTSSITVQAENYSAMAGVQTETTTDAGGGLDVGWIDAGDWMAYNTINFPYSGNYKVEYRVASISGSTLSCDLNAGSIPLGNATVPATGGWQNWTTLSQTVNVAAGTYNFGIYAQAGGWNLNWFRITYLGSAASATPGALTTADNKAALLADSLADSRFVLYPNPASKQLTIGAGYDLSGGKIGIFDATGKGVLAVTPISSVIDISSLTPGVYTLVLTKNKKRIARSFIKVK